MAARELTIDHDESSDYPEESERDEVQEVLRVAKSETSNVRRWRCVVALALLVTAVAVTFTTYTFLGRERYNAFESAFEQIARTVYDAAGEQQDNLCEVFKTFATTITAYASGTNATWPFFTLPNFESYARHVRKQSATKALTIFNRVTPDNRKRWESYANDNYQDIFDDKHFTDRGAFDHLTLNSYHAYISATSPPDDTFVPDVQRENDYFVSWNHSPPPDSYSFINWNLASVSDYEMLLDALIELKNETLISHVHFSTGGSGLLDFTEEHEHGHRNLLISPVGHPHSFFLHPIYETLDDYNSSIVAVMASEVAWDVLLRNVLRHDVLGIHVTIRNNCNQAFTFEISGADVLFIGEGDLHDTDYDDMEVVIDLARHTHPNFTSVSGHCQYSMHIFPSSKFQQSYDSLIPEIFATTAALTFVVVAIIFFVFDRSIRLRNEKLVENAARSNAIVSSFLPSNIHHRLVEQKNEGQTVTTRIHNLKAFLSGEDMLKSRGTFVLSTPAKPLADLFLDTTISFADIGGFTAWSSVREPYQVFKLLETVFQSFDRIAKVRRVFKVETVGDCYVAATGIPDANKKHASVMVLFARSILDNFHVLTNELEITLGPDTGDLSLRIGLHSGPVTAGVLRGERSRFQLFGDTVNTAARIEATGKAGRIHVSQETADRLVQAGKGHWLEKRPEMIQGKGKGDMQTYFIGGGIDREDRASIVSHGSTVITHRIAKDSKIYEQRMKDTGLSEHHLRLVDWNVEMLLGILKQIVARRAAKSRHDRRLNGMTKKPSKLAYSPTNSTCSSCSLSSCTSLPAASRTDLHYFASSPLEEVQEIIHLPEFDSKVAWNQADSEAVVIQPAVVNELREYVTCIATMYQDNAFHNFDHASHVTMSVIKLLSRIVAPTDLEVDEAQVVPGQNGGFNHNQHIAAATLHDHTYGITSDPLTQFACAFSALIHDTDHSGVPNSQLVSEKARIASLYKNRSVAEQNSLVLAWDLLMDEQFDTFRSCLCANETELFRFRQLVVNSVMATDIVDKELKNLRNGRWDVAFKHMPSQDNVRDAVNRKATIVIEHLIQASDVSHTMQHWHVYRKWNELFFRECHAAYKAGRAAKDPSEGWYKGELGFFDFYIIPLAKKLKNCGVFGKSSDEYLNYAKSNREEWEARGERIVEEMMEAIRMEEQDLHHKTMCVQLQGLLEEEGEDLDEKTVDVSIVSA